MDKFSLDDLKNLINQDGFPCLSLYLPTSGGKMGFDQNRIRLKNLLGFSEQFLIQAGYRSSGAQAWLEPASALLQDRRFLEEQSGGLALFLSPDALQSFRLPLSFKEFVVIGDHFHVKPLFSYFNDNGEYYVLVLSQNQVKLYKGSRYTLLEMDLTEVPRSLAEALKYDDTERQLQFHTRAQAWAGGRAAVFYGHSPDEDTKKNILRYFQQIDRGLREVLKDGSQIPLLAAGMDYLLPIYREANTYSHLLEEGVVGNADGLSWEDLHHQAWPLVRPYFEEARKNAANRYLGLMGTGKTTNQLEAALEAARMGRIEVLFLVVGIQQWGSYDPETKQVRLNDGPHVGHQDLLDYIARQTFLHGGTVYAVDAENMPENVTLAALYRY